MSSSSNSSTQTRPLAITLIGSLACLGLVVMPWLAGTPNGEAMPDLVRFIGRFHPVILHLPIGMLTLVYLLELGSILFRKPSQTSSTALFFAAVTSVAAVFAGFLLYQGESDWAASPGATRHLWWGIGFSCVTILTFVSRSWLDRGLANPIGYRAMLGVSAIVMTMASHEGASLTHGPDYLTKYAPPVLKKALGEPVKSSPNQQTTAAPADLVIYSDIVAPMLEEKCWKCHNSEKQKGKFRMDTYDFLVKGGKEGAGIVAGDAAKSNIIIRAELPIDNDERMPPDEKPGLTAEQLVVIKWWLNQGASATATLSSAQVPAEVAAALTTLKPAAKSAAGPATPPATAEKGKETAAHVDSAAAPAATTSASQDANLKSAIADLQKKYPGAAQFESLGSDNITFTAVSMRGKYADDDAVKLGPVLGHLISADFSATEVTDRTVALLKEAKILKSLRLSETKITDAAAPNLAALASLESLNLYGTAVSDATIQQLTALPKLKKLYVWQTKITPAAIEEFKKKAPQCQVISGL